MGSMKTSKKKDPVDTTAEFKTLKTIVTEGEAKRAPWRKEAKRGFNFIANRQWSDEDLAILAEQNRPAVAFNRCAPIVQAVCGLEINNRQQIAYLPREEGDQGIDEAITNIVKWVRDSCNAEDEDSEAFKDAVICGEGWNETRIEYDEDPKGKIIQERVNPLEMGVNKAADKASYEDRRATYRIRDIAPDDARALVGEEYSDQALNASWIEGARAQPEDGGQGNKLDYPDETRAGVEGIGASRKNVRLVQIQWWKREDMVLIAQEGQDELQTLSMDEYKKFGERVAQMQEVDMQNMEEYNLRAEASLAEGMEPLAEPPPEMMAPTFEVHHTKQRVYYEAFLGEGLLSKQKMKLQQFTFNAITGHRDNEKKCFYGLMRDLFDPQMWANKWLSQSMNILNSNAKGGIIAESDAFMNQAKAEKDWADPTKMILVKPGSIQKKKIMDRSPPQLPQGLPDLLQFAIGSMRDVTGVNLELMGQADREQAASLEAQRRQSAMTILAALFNSLRRYRKNQGKLLLHFVWLLPDGVLYRVTSDGDHKYLHFVKNGDVARYDIIIDETPSSPDQKHMVWAITSQILQQGIQFPPAVLVKLMKYSPYPETVVAEITKAYGLGSDMPPEQMKEKLGQAEAALKVLEQQLGEAVKKADTEQAKLEIEKARAEVEAYRAETERMKMEKEAESAENERQLEGARIVAESEDQEKDRHLEGARVATETAAAAEGEDADDRITAMEGTLQEILVALKQMAGDSARVQEGA